MSLLRAVLRRAKASRDDEGFSLMETLVATSIFAVFTGLVLAAITAMLNSTQKSQSLADGTTSLENAFQKLDHQVRYADAINPEAYPTGVAGPWYVEFHSQATSTTPETCTRLKFDPTAKALYEQSWQPAASPIKATKFQQLVGNLVNVPNLALVNTYPFDQQGTGPDAVTGTTLSHQQLRVHLFARPHGSITSKSTVSETDATFTAVNSTKNSGVVCQEVARS